MSNQNIMKLHPISLVSLAVMLNAAVAVHAAPMSTVFTYQGRLVESGAPTSGVYDLEFRLFDLASNGSQQGATVTI